LISRDPAVSFAMLQLLQTPDGLVSCDAFHAIALDIDLDTLFTQADPHAWLRARIAHGRRCAEPETLLAPIQSQEVWAAGITYQRSCNARKEESEAAGGGDFYDRVYHAHRPEIFFKATPHRVAGPGQALTLRSDSNWNVPEPELTLALSSHGQLIGYTVGNDLSSRDIEGENPLYLPQAKTWSRCAALGPRILVTADFPPPSTAIEMRIIRDAAPVFADSATLAQMKQTLPNLVEHLFRDNAFPAGCFLMTGTCVVPGDGFTLVSGDRVDISITGAGTLSNRIA
jgi:2-dehydro-3-deoxy-D-arabinonate dehydratase